MGEQIYMKIYTVVVYNLRMCIQEDAPGLNYFKADTSHSCQCMMEANSGLTNIKGDNY